MKTILAVFYNALEELSDEVEFSTHQSLQIIWPNAWKLKPIKFLSK